MLSSLQTAFKETFPGYQPFLFAVIVGGIIYAFMAYLPVRDLAGLVLTDESISISEKIKFFGEAILELPGGKIFTTLAFLISFLFGVNMTFLAHYLAKRRQALAASNITLSTGALLSGLLGIGCLSCGSLVAAFLASFVGGGSSLFASVVANGWWFIVASILLLILSIALIAKKIAEPMVCEPEYLVSEKRPVIIFDGVCNLCNRAVDFVITHDKRKIFFFADKDGLVAKKLKTDVGLPMEITEKTMLLFQTGTYYTKSRAVLEIVKKLDFPWSLLRVFIVIPRPVRDFLYDFIAKRRSILLRTKHVCRIMTKDLESRFLI